MLPQANDDRRAVVGVLYVRTGMFDGAKSAPLLPLLDPDDVVEEAWTAMLAAHVPASGPQLPTYLESDDGLPRAGRHR